MVPEVEPLVLPVEVVPEVVPAVVVPVVVVPVVVVPVVVVPLVVVTGVGAGSSFFLLHETKTQVAEIKPILRNDTKSFFMNLFLEV